MRSLMKVCAGVMFAVALSGCRTVCEELPEAQRAAVAKAAACNITVEPRVFGQCAGALGRACGSADEAALTRQTRCYKELPACDPENAAGWVEQFQSCDTLNPVGAECFASGGGAVKSCAYYVDAPVVLAQKVGSCEVNVTFSVVRALCEGAFARKSCNQADAATLESLVDCYKALPTCVPGQEMAWTAQQQACVKQRTIGSACGKALEGL